MKGFLCNNDKRLLKQRFVVHFIRRLAIFLVVATIVQFSSIGSVFFTDIGLPQAADGLGVKTAQAANLQIRQEINILDGVLTATASNVTSSEIIQLDTTKYNGATYYFEIVASSSATSSVTLRRNGGSTDDAIITVATGTAALTRFRSTAFTPPAGITQYLVQASGTATGLKSIKAARIVIIQNAATITNTETQIEIGNNETGKTNTTTSTGALTSPKYWNYNSATWDGSPAFTASVSYKKTDISTLASSSAYAAAGSFTWTAPASISPATATVELWGGGGAGGNASSSPGAGCGGAGGSYTILNSTSVTPGTGYGVKVAATSTGIDNPGPRGASSSFNGATAVAVGGNGGGMNSACVVATGTTTGNVGTTFFLGGNGGLASSTAAGGGGGGGAGSTGAGGNAAISSGGLGTNLNGGNGATGTTASAAGAPGTLAGGGGAGGHAGNSTDRNGGNGAIGQAKISYHIVDSSPTSTIVLQEDNGSFASWTDRVIIVNASLATTSTYASSTFTPTSGRNYRIVGKIGTTSSTYDIYNAKIIVDQANPTLLEPHYLLANTMLASGTALQGFLTDWDTTEWAGTTNTYLHQIDSIANSTTTVELDSTSSVQITGSSIASPNNLATSTLTMPVTKDLDVKITTDKGNIYASRILVQVVFPVVVDATSFTDSGGLSDGGKSGDSITITGTNFGTVAAGSRANCAGGAGTGCVRFLGIGGNATATVADADVTAWSATSITFNVSTTLATLGATSSLQVCGAGVCDSTPLTFYVYPHLTGMAVCTNCNANAAREYNASDTDGLIMLNGDHFAATTGTVSFTGNFGSLSGNIHAVVEGPCTASGWIGSATSSNTVCVEVTSTIVDTVSTGTVTLQRNADVKTDVISLTMLPRILSETPTSSAVQTVIDIKGNHLCESGTCITSNRATASDNVTFGSATSTDSSGIVVIDATSTATCTGTGCSGLTFSLTVGPSGTNRALGVFVNAASNSGNTEVTVSSITYNGVGLVQKIHAAPSSERWIDLWTLPDGTQPVTGTHNVVVTLTGALVGANDRLTAGAISLTGVDQTSQLTSTSTNSGSGTSLSVTLGSSGSNDVVVASACNGTSLSTTHTGTQFYASGNDSATACNTQAGITAAGGTTSLTWTGGNDTWTFIAASFKGGSSSSDFQNLTGGAGTCNGSGAAWSSTEICVKVPAAASAGSASTTITSNTSYLSNVWPFTVIATAPNGPTSLNQYLSDGVTALSVGSSTTSTTVVFKANLSASTNINMQFQVEATSTANSFVCSGTGACAAAAAGTTYNATTSVTGASVTLSNLPSVGDTGTAYHWQARAWNTSTSEASAWTSFGGNGEGATDFDVDTNAPTITNVATSSVSASAATITWNTSAEFADSRVQYGTGIVWTNGYTYRRAITASSSLISTANHTSLSNFPMLVSSTLSDLATTGHGGSVTNANGYDIIFTSDASGTSKLNFEQEYYNSSTGAVDYWVNVPTLSSSTSNTIYMFYASSSVSTFQSSATSTWSNSYTSVWHLKETGTGAVGDYKDSTVYANNSTSTARQPTASTGSIDGAQSFNGNIIKMNSLVLATSTAPFTASAWANLTDFSLSAAPEVVGLKTNAINSWNFLFSNSSNYLGITIGAADTWATIKTGNTPSLGAWHYVVATYNGNGAGTISNFQIYLDNSLQTLSATLAGYGPTNNSTTIGDIAQSDGSGSFNAWVGKIDEVRVSSVVRSADWIQTEYNNQSNPSTFYTISSAVGGANFAASCATNNDCTAVTDAVPPGTNSHSVGLTSLSSSTLYYFRVRSKDALGNESLSPTSNFFTTSSASNALPATGQLNSVVFDTTATNGAAYNSILWKGTAGTGKVQFQLATSNSSSGPWNFYGSNDGGITCNSSLWYDTTGPDSPVELTCAPFYHNNHEYFRYKIQLCSNSDCATVGTTSPTVTSVVVNWSP